MRYALVAFWTNVPNAVFYRDQNSELPVLNLYNKYDCPDITSTMFSLYNSVQHKLQGTKTRNCGWSN